ncbi:NUDIX domain-containing protein [Streptomyces noursei]|uniref:NUDIX domain-containing protein n=1 Tax=Streptomyces noursei TaxID=1971 RepID=UPI00331E84E3
MTVTSPEFLAGLVNDARAEGITGLVTAAVVTDADQVLFVRRHPDDFMGGMWEIPSGKVEDGETVLEALQRETVEEVSDAVRKLLGP